MASLDLPVLRHATRIDAQAFIWLEVGPGGSMRGFRFAVPALLCLISSFSAASDFLVISDIDDTLKVSHVRSALDVIDKGLRTDLSFPGMPELLNDFSALGAKMYYVSAAPEALLGGLHREFLQQHDFPRGDVFLSPGFDKQEKLPRLRAILRQENPRTVILLGDNGEADPVNSAALVREFPEIRFFTYIRWAYPDGQYSRIENGQVFFLTAAEIALDLWSQGAFPEASVKKIILASMPPTEELLGLPDWIDCRGYSARDWFYPQAQLLVNDLIDGIKVRCPRDASWDFVARPLKKRGDSTIPLATLPL